MSTIVSLPPEVIYHIGSHLSIADNKILRYVCRYISQAVEPLALSSVAFCLDAEVLFLCAKKLRAYAARTTKAAARVRKLAVVAIEQLDDSGNLRTEWFDPPASTDSPEDHEQLLQVFCDLLLSLDNVTNFDWYLDDGMPEHIIAKVLSFLSSAPIKTFSMMYNRRAFVAGSLLHLPHPFQTVRKLEFIELVSSRLVRTHAGIVQLTPLLRRLIANCPNLQQLSLKATVQKITPQTTVRLHDFLPHETTGTTATPALQLEHLSVTHLRLDLDPAMLHHLRALQYLRIRFPLTTPVHGDPISTVMNTLWTEKIHLRGLNLNIFDVDNAVLEYLLSYANKDIIQDITFDNRSQQIYNEADIASVTATRFFAEVLPAVAGSLVSLIVTTDQSDSWSFDPSYVDSIKPCHKLENLRLYVGGEAGNKAEEALKEIRQHLPHLLSLEIDRIWTPVLRTAGRIWS